MIETLVKRSRGGAQHTHTHTHLCFAAGKTSCIMQMHVITDLHLRFLAKVKKKKKSVIAVLVNRWILALTLLHLSHRQNDESSSEKTERCHHKHLKSHNSTRCCKVQTNKEI